MFTNFWCDLINDQKGAKTRKLAELNFVFASNTMLLFCYQLYFDTTMYTHKNMLRLIIVYYTYTDSFH